MSAEPSRSSRLDRLIEARARDLARRVSRRAFLGRLGAVLAGSAAFPLLPVARASAQMQPSVTDVTEEKPAGWDDPDHCNYWRHCAVDGFLCGCCGGSGTSCPPGTEMAPTTWIGTCRNPDDGRHYLISYNDCCGKDFCGRCFCNRNEGDRPVYYPHRSNDINWCSGATATSYNCSVAVVLGESKEAQPER